MMPGQLKRGVRRGANYSNQSVCLQTNKTVKTSYKSIMLLFQRCDLNKYDRKSFIKRICKAYLYWNCAWTNKIELIYEVDFLLQKHSAK